LRVASHVKLLGAPAVGQGNDWLEPPAGKTSALLYYLAYQRTWVGRDELVYLLWPDSLEEKARQNLRQLLNSVRKLPYAQDLESEATRLRWQVVTDVHEFRNVLKAGQLSHATQLYEGELLHGFRLPEAPEFERWLELERQELHQAWRKAVLTLANELGASGRHPQAVDLLERLHKVDPLDEEVLRRYLQVLQLNHQRARALEVFKTFQQSLADELGGEPERLTLQLVERIRQEEGLEVRLPEPAPPGYRPPHHLPVPPTPFIGREEDQSKLSTLLSDSTCRLLTVAGPGGMGKTRLAIEAAQAQQGRFREGVHFVALASVSSPERIVFAVADAVGFSFFGPRAPSGQLLDYLQDKEMLLVLDNLEHLLSGVNYISDLLEHAPKVKVLATSRERLNLHAEWVFDLHGLSVPEEAGQAAQEHDAVRLFVQSATHARSDFTLDASTLPAVVRICQLVQGMPLAIELAATWLRALTLEDIMAEIERGCGIDLLETSTRDVPARHRSIRAVFDSSWKLLTPDEQAVLRQLSVFQGGFRREAAAKVAGATLPMLATLVDKSFLTLTPHGRYRRHPLVLQYTQEKLDTRPDERARVQEAHGLYYLHLVQEKEDALTMNKETFRVVEEELSNIRSAWTWALKNERLDEIKASAFALSNIFVDRVAEGERFFAQTAAALDASNPRHQLVLGYALLMRGGQLMGLTRIEEAAACVRRGLDLLWPFDDAKGKVVGLYTLGVASWILGDFQQARALLEEGLVLSRAHPEFNFTGYLLFYRASVEREFGTFPQVRQFFHEALAEVEPLGDLAALAMLKHEYGVYLSQYGCAEEGEGYVREGLELIRKVHEPAFESNILVNLALVCCRLGRFDEAESLALEVQGKATKFSMRDMLAKALERLGRVALARGLHSDAQRHLKESLRVAWVWTHQFSVLDALIRLAELFIMRGDVIRASEWLGLVRHQRGYLKEHDLEAERLLALVRQQMSEQELEQALERGEVMKLEKVVPELLETL
jgi:predicted ATPase/DNA-binding SARP family transcriptional activator